MHCYIVLEHLGEAYQGHHKGYANNNLLMPSMHDSVMTPYFKRAVQWTKTHYTKGQRFYSVNGIYLSEDIAVSPLIYSYSYKANQTFLKVTMNK